MSGAIDCTLTVDHCRAEVDGRTYETRGRNAFYNLCRELEGAGFGLRGIQARASDGSPTISAPSIANAALWTVRENSNEGPKLVRWKPFGGVE